MCVFRQVLTGELKFQQKGAPGKHVLSRVSGQVLTVELKFQQKPFEWAYEGLAPLLLPEVLRTRRGISLSLALLGSSVGRRLGLCLLPLPVRLTGGEVFRVDVGACMLARSAAAWGCACCRCLSASQVGGFQGLY
jgi:hypothetical protein